MKDLYITTLIFQNINKYVRKTVQFVKIRKYLTHDIIQAQKEELIMSKIEAVFFDYGETLIHEIYFNPLKGTKAVLKYSNKPNFDVEIIQELAKKYSYEQRMYQKEGEEENYLEIPNRLFQHYLYDYYDIQINLSDEEMEKIFWNIAAPYEKIDGAQELLEFLMKRNIKIGVVSNISFNKKLLTERLYRIYPNIKFDVIVTSADYCIRKPNSLIFDIACTIAHVDKTKTIYIGDQIKADYEGANNAGLRGLLISDMYFSNKKVFKNLKYVKGYIENEI